MKRERAVVGYRPGSCGPNDGGDIRAELCCFMVCATDVSKLHPDARAGMIFIFGFGERGRIVNAPIDRLASAKDVSLFHEIEESIGNSGLVLMAHGEIRIIPAAKDTETLEVALVLLNIPRCKFTTEASKFRR